MKKFVIIWKHSKENTKGEVQNLIPPQIPYIAMADSEDIAREEFDRDYPALYIHDIKEV